MQRITSISRRGYNGRIRAVNGSGLIEPGGCDELSSQNGPLVAMEAMAEREGFSIRHSCYLAVILALSR